jgi:hypothetical protein
MRNSLLVGLMKYPLHAFRMDNLLWGYDLEMRLDWFDALLNDVTFFTKEIK